MSKPTTPAFTSLELSKLAKRRIRDRNRRYRNATPEQKRVMVARDVLQQIEFEKYQPSCGVYLNIPRLTEFKADLEATTPWHGGFLYEEYQAKINANLTAPLRESLEEADIKCRVCALGAVYMSAVRMRNDATLANAVSGGIRVSRQVTDLFDLEQRDLIESCFEGMPMYSLEHGYGSLARAPALAALHKRIRDFARKHLSADDRMKIIMKNIIRNNGTFVLDQEIAP